MRYPAAWFVVASITACSRGPDPVDQVIPNYQHEESARYAEGPVTPVRNWKLLGSQGTHRFVVMAQQVPTDREGYRAAFDDACRTAPVCQVAFWVDESKAARGLPMGDEQVNAQVATWGRNRNTGFDQFRVACRIERTAGCF